MKKLFDALRQALRNGEDAVLVTIVASSGSAPRGTGARMLVTARGRVCGTIGGGAVEYKGEQIAAEILRTKRSRQESFRLYKNDVADLGMVCGGAVDVYFRFISAGDAGVADLIDRCGEIALALWEGEIDSTAAKNRIRVLLNDLRTALRAIGMEDVLIRQRRQLAIDRSNVDCDYYRMLDGDISMINAYRGEYMKQYSWAELTTAKLHFRK